MNSIVKNWLVGEMLRLETHFQSLKDKGAPKVDESDIRIFRLAMQEVGVELSEGEAIVNCCSCISISCLVVGGKPISEAKTIVASFAGPSYRGELFEVFLDLLEEAGVGIVVK